MNALTKLKFYLDKCIAGGKPTQSKFRITSRSYNDKLNQHEVEILFTYRKADDLQVSTSTNSTKKHHRKLFDEIVRTGKPK